MKIIILPASVSVKLYCPCRMKVAQCAYTANA